MRVLNRSFNKQTISAKCKTDYFSFNYNNNIWFIFYVCGPYTTKYNKGIQYKVFSQNISFEYSINVKYMIKTRVNH